MSSTRTPTGVLSFPHLFVPKPRVQGGTEAVYSLTLIFDEKAQGTEEYKALKAAVFRAIANKWGDDKAKDPKFVAKLRLPFRDASEKDYDGYGPGKVFIAAWSKQKPGIVDGNVDAITVASDVWAGQLARCTVVPFAYSSNGNQGVSFGLEHVQIVAVDTPRLDGRKSVESAFDKVASAPKAGGDDSDDMPF